MGECEHSEKCNCYGMGYRHGELTAWSIVTADENVEFLLGKSLVDAFEQDDFIDVIERLLNPINFNKFVVNELFQRIEDPSVLKVVQEINGKWNALVLQRRVMLVI